MTEEATKLLRGWHRLQSRRDGCVAACHAMVDVWRGGEGIERADAASVGGEVASPSAPGSLELLTSRVRRNCLAIISVHPGPWMDLARGAKRKSPYGDLDRTLHAVVVASFDPKTKLFVVLDPYFETPTQPTYVSRDDLAACWTGQVEFHPFDTEE